MELEIPSFVSHVQHAHTCGEQTFACPICSKIGYEYSVTPKTNLLTHLQNGHEDLWEASIGRQSSENENLASSDGSHSQNLGSSDGSLSQNLGSSDGSLSQNLASSDSSMDSDDPLLTSSQIMPVDVGNEIPFRLPTCTGQYIVSTLTQNLAQSCLICYEEFVVGAVIARLDCLCLFHQICIDRWFSKKGQTLCPLHSVQ
eukprot:TRINITY_DN4141_c0_g1_i6.p1 TRINITY_DN4141_c0_g1~~TRINITY_DN4141_c0_g1_i6.p1  ORF type:complete len:200 (-),score=24.87 TRINITY_DN4141_c0_g1_i6:51-650(-)